MTVDAGALARAAAVLKGARSVVIGSHVDPDGDAVGSALALAAALDLADIPVTVVSANGRGCPVTYSFLPGADRFVPTAAAPAHDVFVALDSPVLARLGDAGVLAEAAGQLVAIDHHPDAAIEASVRVFDSAAAATGLLVWYLVPHLGVTPNADIATCTYTALLSDTGRFSYANTTPEALRAAAEMIESGVDPHAVYSAVYENRSAAAHALITRTLDRVTLANDGRVAYSWIDAADFTETGALPEESENLIDQLRPLAGIEVAFLAKSIDGTVRISLRAKGAQDVGTVARAFGGGGHRAAAGFTYEGTLSALLPALLQALPGGR
jgi:phosphoesterase RecJ-like protein